MTSTGHCVQRRQVSLPLIVIFCQKNMLATGLDWYSVCHCTSQLNFLFLLYQIPEEEKNLGANDRLIHVYHFTKETAQNQMVIQFYMFSAPSESMSTVVIEDGKYLHLNVCFSQHLLSTFQQQVQNFGEPFFLVIHEGETLAEVKARIQKKLQVPDEEFAKVLDQHVIYWSTVEHEIIIPCLIIHFVLFYSGSLHSCHWVVPSTYRTLMQFLVVFRYGVMSFCIVWFSLQKS